MPDDQNGSTRGNNRFSNAGVAEETVDRYWIII